MQVADTLRLEPRILRSTLSDIQSRPVQREIPNAPQGEFDDYVRPRARPMPRPGLEALRLLVHAPAISKERFIAQYFVNETQREIFEGLTSGQAVGDVVATLERRGDVEAVRVLSELVVDEIDRDHSSADVTAVVSQLLRAAVDEQLKGIERELRGGTIAPDVAMATIRDVKERLAMLETPHGEVAEVDLRNWLLDRASSAAS